MTKIQQTLLLTCLLQLLVCTYSKQVQVPEDFLPNWMQYSLPYIQDLSVLDLSLPGTHDTLTYDLSLLVSERANDIPLEFSYLLNHYMEYVPLIGKYMRSQAKTQGLNITAQLNSGVRFLDLRIVLTRNQNIENVTLEQWFSLHMMQSNHPAFVYLREIRAWLDAHPQEIIVVALTRHGSFCANDADQYPFTTIAQKQRFWLVFKKIFQGMLFDGSLSPLNQTSISQLLQRNQRVVVYAGDYAHFTDNSPLAMDACFIENVTGGGSTELQAAYDIEVAQYKDMARYLVELKKKNRFYLRQLAAGAPGLQYVYSFIIDAIGFNIQPYAQRCANLFHIPNSTYCPLTLQAISQLTNYYKQLSFDVAYKNGYRLPNAFYLDAVDEDGTIRIGTQDFPKAQAKQEDTPAAAATDDDDELTAEQIQQNYETLKDQMSMYDATELQRYKDLDNIFDFKLSELIKKSKYVEKTREEEISPSNADIDTKTRKYAYSWVVLYSTLNYACTQILQEQGESAVPLACETNRQYIVSKIEQYPLTTWTKNNQGRVQGWPQQQLQDHLSQQASVVE